MCLDRRAGNTNRNDIKAKPTLAVKVGFVILSWIIGSLLQSKQSLVQQLECLFFVFSWN